MATSKTSICNLALAEVPQGPIQDYASDDSKAGAECRRVYSQALGELLEACSWTFATRRVQLASTTNPRGPAWAYAYALPANLGVVRRIVPGPSTLGSYQPTVGQTLAPPMVLSGDFNAREQSYPYERDEGLIYCDLAGAVIEFTRTDPPETAMPPLFVRALYLDIAGRITVPLTGDQSRRGQLIALHEQAKGRAMAADMNRRPLVIDPIPDALLVR